MSRKVGRDCIYEFGEFRLHVGQLMLYRGTGEIPLRPKAVETLVALVERHGEIVTKDELMESIWAEAIVEETNLSRYIHILRLALGNQADGKPFIETYRRRGFRFNAEVRISSIPVATISEARRELNSASRKDSGGATKTGTVIELAGWRREVAETEPDEYRDAAPGISRNQHNLPVPLTELIGRGTEVEELTALLKRDKVRLVTLTGTGGTGKTRLAIQVASDLLEEFTDGVFLVQLAPVREPALIASTIARALKLNASLGPALDDLKMVLSGRSTLLVLDNFEQLLEASPLVAELLEASPHLKVMATSRAALHVRGEYEYAVMPLSLPGSAQSSPTEALRSAAVRLFVERANQASFRFAITDKNASTVVEICRRLDGLPLAIELAALRIRNLTPEDILDRLERRLELLSDGPRDLPARQQTIRDAIIWSHELLTESEKNLFRRLAIFEAGFELLAAEEVTGDKEEQLSSDSVDSPSFQIAIFDGVTSLCDKGLLIPSDEPDGGSRFKMLQVVRELALELLEASGEADILRRRHAEYYASFGEKAGPYLQTENSSQWLARLERDHDNLRAAIRWLLDNDPSRAAHLTASIRTYFLVKLHLAEGREWLEMALERDPHAPAPVRFNLLNSLGLMALVRGDYVEARKAFERNLSESKMSDGTLDISDSLRGLGAAASSLMDFATAQTAFEEALAIDRRSENALGLAKTLLGLGALMFFQRDFEKARALTLESLMTYRKIGYKSGICSSLLNLGEYACRTSDLTSSRKFFAEGLAIATLEGYRDRLSFCLDGFAALAAEQDDWNDAVRLMGAAEKLRETIGVSPEPDTDNFRNLYLERSLHKLGRESFSMLYEQGRAMTVDEAIALATGMHKAEKKKRIAPADDPRYAS